MAKRIIKHLIMLLSAIVLFGHDFVPHFHFYNCHTKVFTQEFLNAYSKCLNKDLLINVFSYFSHEENNQIIYLSEGFDTVPKNGEQKNVLIALGSSFLYVPILLGSKIPLATKLFVFKPYKNHSLYLFRGPPTML